MNSLIANGNDTFTDTDRHQGGGNVTAPIVAGTAPSSDSESDTDIDDETDQSGGQSLENDYSLETTTDPTTGVVTNLFSGDSVQDKSSGQAGIHDSDTSNSNFATTLSQGAPTVTVNDGTDTDNETDNSFGNDTTTTGGNISLSVVGSPAAGQTENINEKIQLGGNDQYQENSNGGSEEDSSSSYNGTPGTAASSDTISGNETLKDKDIGNQTVGIIGNSTISILDPTTNLTTTDTLIDNGSLKVGYNGNDTLTDNHPASAITTAGEDDLTNDDQMKETLNGNDQSTETLTVNGTTPDGTTVNSTETIGDKGTLIGNTTDHDTGNTTVTGYDANLSIAEGDTDVSGDDIKTGDQTTDKLQFQSSGTDPTTGLQQSVTINDNSTDQEDDEEIDSDTDAESNSTFNAATGASASASDDDNFDDKLIESGKSTDNPLIVINTQGTDSQGEQVNSQEIILLNGNATATVNDEDIGEDTSGIASKPATADTETVHADVLSHATLSDAIGGSIVSVNPNTGVKTTTTDNLSITGSDDEHDDEDETDSQSDGVGQDTITQTDTDPMRRKLGHSHARQVSSTFIVPQAQGMKDGLIQVGSITPPGQVILLVIGEHPAEKTYVSLRDKGLSATVSDTLDQGWDQLLAMERTTSLYQGTYGNFVRFKGLFSSDSVDGIEAQQQTEAMAAVQTQTLVLVLAVPATEMAIKSPSLNPLNYRLVADRSTLTVGGMGAVGIEYVGPEGGALLYEVDLAKNLRLNTLHGVPTDTIAEHGPQTKWARALVPGHKAVNHAGWEPAIRVTAAEADAITAAELLTKVPAGARDALALKINLLRNLTNAPNSSLRQLIQLNKQLHPTDYLPLNRLEELP